VREKYLIGPYDRRVIKPNKKALDFAVQFDEAQGEVMFRSALNHSDRLDILVFDRLELKRPRGDFAKRSGIHLKTYYRYILPCRRTQFRVILALIQEKYSIFKTTKLWRK